MVKYLCNRCGYTTTHRHNFKNHLNRKNPCSIKLEDISIDKIKALYSIPIDTKIIEESNVIVKQIKSDNTNIMACSKNICNFCNKTFTRNYGLKVHTQTCKVRLEELEKKNRKKETIKDKVEDLLIELTHKNNIINSTITTNNTTNNNTIHNNNKIVNININNYGNENTEYINKEYLTNLLGGAFNAIPKLIENIHFNPKHPENHNIKITNKKEPYIKVRKNNKWHLQDKKETIEYLVDDKYYILEDHYEDIDDNNLKDHTKTMIDNFIDRFKHDEELLKTIQRKTEMVILNHSQ